MFFRIVSSTFYILQSLLNPFIFCSHSVFTPAQELLIEDAWQKGLKAFGSDQQREKLNKLLHDITAADDNGTGLEQLKV